MRTMRKKVPSEPVRAKRHRSSEHVKFAVGRTDDGAEKLDVAVSRSGMRRLASAARLQEEELEWLHLPLSMMMINLYAESEDRLPSVQRMIGHLQKVQSATRKLQGLLSPK